MLFIDTILLYIKAIKIVGVNSEFWDGDEFWSLHFVFSKFSIWAYILLSNNNH